MPGTLIADRDGRYVDADDEGLAILGMSLDELRSARIGDLSGPHAEMAISVWRRLAATGEDMSSGEGTLYLPTGTEVRVRYLRISALASGDYELVLEPIAVDTPDADRPPVADRPSLILREWRAAERDAEAAGASDAAAPEDATEAADKLRKLYHDSLLGRTGTPTKS